MRTAEEILKKIKAESIWGDMGDDYAEDDVIKAINEARIEAIEESAKVATAFSIGYDGQAQVKKESILDLINQLK
jgi:hypothetical protein